MNVLITGGAGYLGSTLVPLLLGKGHRVRVLDSLLHTVQPLAPLFDHPHFDFFEADIRDRKILSAALKGVDAVVHLAAIVGDPACARNRVLAHDVNLEASRVLLEEAGSANVRRFAFASTCSNYGRMSDSEAYVDEASPLMPLSIYANTKVQFEKELTEGKRFANMSTVLLRFATLYGASPRMRFDLTVNEFTLDLLRKRRLTVFGEKSWRPYVHVRDAARAIICVLDTDLQIDREVFNVGATDQNFRKIDVVDMIRPHACEASVEYVQNSVNDMRDYRVNFDKIFARLRFVTKRTVQDGITEVAQLIKQHPFEPFDSGVFRN